MYFSIYIYYYIIVNVYTHIQRYTYAYIYIYIGICKHTHIHTYPHTHIYIYTYLIYLLYQVPLQRFSFCCIHCPTVEPMISEVIGWSWRKEAPVPPLSKKQVSWWTSERVKLWISRQGGSKELPEGSLVCLGQSRRGATCGPQHMWYEMGNQIYESQYPDTVRSNLQKRRWTMMGICFPTDVDAYIGEETTRCNQCWIPRLLPQRLWMLPAPLHQHHKGLFKNHGSVAVSCPLPSLYLQSLLLHKSRLSSMSSLPCWRFEVCSTIGLA